MKRGELEKRQASKLTNQMRAAGNDFGPAVAQPLDRRAQRDRDRALGLVPFAVKLPQELVNALQQQATTKGVALNDLTAELLRKSLAK